MEPSKINDLSNATFLVTDRFNDKNPDFSLVNVFNNNHLNHTSAVLKKIGDEVLRQQPDASALFPNDGLVVGVQIKTELQISPVTAQAVLNKGSSPVTQTKSEQESNQLNTMKSSPVQSSPQSQQTTEITGLNNNNNNNNPIAKEHLNILVNQATSDCVYWKKKDGVSFISDTNVIPKSDQMDKIVSYLKQKNLNDFGHKHQMKFPLESAFHSPTRASSFLKKDQRSISNEASATRHPLSAEHHYEPEYYYHQTQFSNPYLRISQSAYDYHKQEQIDYAKREEQNATSSKKLRLTSCKHNKSPLYQDSTKPKKNNSFEEAGTQTTKNYLQTVMKTLNLMPQEDLKVVYDYLKRMGLD
ncbi:hypothetical protein QTN25_006804 [Entamoeba marina]